MRRGARILMTMKTLVACRIWLAPMAIGFKIASSTLTVTQAIILRGIWIWPPKRCDARNAKLAIYLSQYLIP